MQFNKYVDKCIIIGAIAIYAIVAVLGWFKDMLNFEFCVDALHMYEPSVVSSTSITWLKSVIHSFDYIGKSIQIVCRGNIHPACSKLRHFPLHGKQRSSSWILCGSILSRTSSGNHCRSDPVQVQSTWPSIKHCSCAHQPWPSCCFPWASEPIEFFNLFIVTPKGVQPPALCNASAALESPWTSSGGHLPI